MSVTEKVIDTGIMGDKVKMQGSVSGDNHHIRFYVEAAMFGFKPVNGSTTYSQEFRIYPPRTARTDSYKITLTWQLGERFDLMGTVYYKNAVSNYIDIPYPFFSIVPINATEQISFSALDDISLYDIENAKLSISVTGGNLDGSSKASRTISFNTHKSVDATYDEYWFFPYLGGDIYSFTDIPVTRSVILQKEWCKQYLSSCEKASLNVYVGVYYGSYLYGSYSGSADVYVPSAYQPSISAVTLKDLLGKVPSSWSAFVQHYSNVGISSITAEASYGSSISQYSIDVEEAGSSSGWVNSYSAAKTGTFSQYGTYTVTVSVKDARGRTASKSAAISILQYDVPKFISVDSDRCAKDGSADNDGKYFLATLNTSYSSCNGKNVLKLEVWYRSTDTNTWPDSQHVAAAAISAGQITKVYGGGTLDTEKSYDVHYRLTDQFNTIDYYDYVSTSIWLIHFKEGGHGVAFGQMATKDDTVDLAWAAYFRKGVTFLTNKGHEVTIQQIIDALNLDK